MAFLREETPNYKLNNMGTGALSDVELLAMIIGGNADDAADKARRLMSTAGNLHNLGKMLIRDMIGIGLTQRQAATVTAAIALGVRRQMTDIPTRPKISSSRDAYDAIGPLLVDLYHEEFWIIIVNKANEVTERVHMSTGGVAGTVVDMKLIFREAIMRRAAAIILVHNHPSGNLKPSEADLSLTKRARRMGQDIDMPVLDHLIVSERGYYSFADEGAL